MLDKILKFGPTKDFGVPVDAIHFFSVVIRDDEVLIIENLENDYQIPRAKIKREVWDTYSDILKSVFNKRLQDTKLTKSKWKEGENFVDRLLGKELCLLVLIIGDGQNNYHEIIRNWLALRTEERWWLYSKINNDSGNWVEALRIAWTN